MLYFQGNLMQNKPQAKLTLDLDPPCSYISQFQVRPEALWPFVAPPALTKPSTEIEHLRGPVTHLFKVSFTLTPLYNLLGISDLGRTIGVGHAPVAKGRTRKATIIKVKEIQTHAL